VQGAWPGLFGLEGYLLASAATNLPAFAAVSVRGGTGNAAAEFQTTDARALFVPGANYRSAGYWASTTNLQLDLNLMDGFPHRVALYSVDWIEHGGAQTVQVLDAVTSTVLDQRTMTNFLQGVYLSWDIVGHVVFRFARSSSFGPALLSAVFFDRPVTVSQVALLAPANGSRFAAPAPISFSAFAASAFTNISEVDFFANGTLLGSDFTGPPFTYTWTNPSPGSYSVTAQALDAGSGVLVSAPIGITVEAASAAAVFAGFDTNRQGNWIGRFGLDGFVIAGDSTNLPPWMTLNINSQFYLWAANTGDVRALQQSTGGSRVAATWYAFTNLTIDVKLTDLLFHRVSLYALDWQGLGAVDSIDVVDEVSGGTLDHRDLGGFANGIAAAWDVKGHVLFRVATRTRLPAMVSGIFLDPGGVLPPLTLSPITGTIFVVPTNIFLQANGLADRNIMRVDFYAGATLVGSASNGPPYTCIWSNPPPGTWSLSAQEISALTTSNSAPSVVRVFASATQVMPTFSATALANGTLRLDVTVPEAHVVRLDAATNLYTGIGWQPIYTNTSGANQFFLVVPDPAVFPQRYYRATVQP
jgi:hypothetical protein